MLERRSEELKKERARTKVVQFITKVAQDEMSAGKPIVADELARTIVYFDDQAFERD